MNVSSVSDTYILVIDYRLTSGSTTAPGTSGNNAPAIGSPDVQGGSSQLSPLAKVLSELQQLQQQNPTEYAQVTGQIATKLQSAAQTAQTDGNSSAAGQLNQLATDFTNASQSGQLPDIQDLAQAVGGGHHHHHGHHHSSSADSTSGTSDSSSADSSSASNNSTGQNPFLAAVLENNSQNGSPDPFSIILNALSGAVSGGSNS